METFWYRLTRSTWNMAVKTDREREKSTQMAGQNFRTFPGPFSTRNTEKSRPTVVSFMAFKIAKHDTMKKVFRETQTLRAGCSKANPRIFAPSLGRRTAKI